MYQYLTLFILSAWAACGPAVCYTGCTDARVPVDFVFLIDVSGSMKEEISGVVGGLTEFAKSLDTNQMDPLYSVVTFAGSSDPYVRRNMVDFSSLKTYLSSISLNGGREAGLEALRCSLGLKCPHSINNGPINYRTDAKKVFIILTDEDSDPSYWSTNRVGYQGSVTSTQACYQSSVNTLITDFTGWQAEIDDTANSLISASVATYLMVNPNFSSKNTCLTPWQYCDPSKAVQNSDYSGFNFTGTLNNLLADSRTQGSLQSQLLQAGVTSRCFSVEDANDPDLVKNFFKTITADIQICDQPYPCYEYPCLNGKCLEPVNICGCDNIPYSGTGYDCAGVCGGSAMVDCSGKCDAGYSIEDKCNQCTLGGVTPSECVQDCLGDWYLSTVTGPPHTEDLCGTCVADPVYPPFCKQNCTGAWVVTDPMVYDPVCVRDCMGVLNGDHYLTNCGDCVDLSTEASYPCHQDCAGKWYTQSPGSTMDLCGLCLPVGSPNRDNIGDCGVCLNTPGYVYDTECPLDCTGKRYPAGSTDAWVVDTCGNCRPVDSVNDLMDTCGLCWPSKNDSSWDSSLLTDSQGETCCFTYSYTDCPGYPGTTACYDCPEPPCGSGVPDACGFCPGEGQIDTCGVCCSGDTCNQDVDSCGVCFGFDQNKEVSPCGTCDITDTSCYDCAGTPYGNATLDCADVCNGNTTCSVCGNGIVELGEACDGTPECGTDCQVIPPAESKGKIIGSVIGALAGLGLLALVAIIAYRHAVKNGLFGRSTKDMDMTPALTNPLYEGNTQTISNPLYESSA